MDPAADGDQDYRSANALGAAARILYQSASHVQLQVQMGLYGAVAAAYPAGSFASQDQVLVFSEIDPALHGATPGTANMLDYAPRYFLINGKPDGLGGPASPVAATAQATLLRLVNAGFADRAPQLLGAYFNVVGEDGNAAPAGVHHSQYNALLAAGRTVDISVAAPAGTYPLYDRRLGLVNGDASGGGMRTSLVVSGAVPPPTAVGDSYSAVFGTALNVGAPGVLSNDTPQLLTATRITNPADGTLTFNADGSFQYQPVASGVTGPRSFTYTASNTAGITSAPATVTINVTPPGGGGPTNHAPTAVPDFFYISANTSGSGSKTATWTSPGVLASPGSTPDSDPDGDLLRVAPGSVTALSPVVAGQSLAVDTGTGATKGQVAFTYAYNWLGDATFNYSARDINASPLDSAPAAVHIVRDFRFVAVTNLLATNVIAVQRSFSVPVTYEMLVSGPSCPVAINNTVVDSATVPANTTAVGNANLIANAQTLRWTGTNAQRSACSNVTLRAQIPAVGAVPAHTASSTVALGFRASLSEQARHEHQQQVATLGGTQTAPSSAGRAAAFAVATRDRRLRDDTQSA